MALRLLESILYCVCWGSLFFADTWSMTPVTAAVVQAAAEGVRWHEYLMYAAILLGKLHTYSGWALPRVLAIVLLALCGVAFVLFPYFRLPAVTGPHPVGVIDGSWKEQDVLHAARIWYPCDPSESVTTGRKAHVAYLFGAKITTMIRAYSFLFPLPSLRSLMYLADYLRVIRTNSYNGAKISEAQSLYPVVLFSHGLLGFPEAYTSLCEEMASQGYVVVALRHTDQSAPFLGEKGTGDRGCCCCGGGVLREGCG